MAKLDIPFVTSAAELPTHSDILNGAPCYDSLFAVGVEIDAEWVFTAYHRGLFPWYSAGEPVLWHSPDPRMVLPIANFKTSPSLRKTLRKWSTSPLFPIRVTLNQAFEQVMAACANTPRDGQDDTWITPELAKAYIDLHHQRHAVSIEVWRDDLEHPNNGSELIAGLYGVLIGKMFFGESMFTRVSDGSKVALACWVEYLQQEGFDIIDCQQVTEHLSRLGGAPISRAAFFQRSSKLMRQSPPDWEKMCAADNLLKPFQA